MCKLICKLAQCLNSLKILLKALKILASNQITTHQLFRCLSIYTWPLLHFCCGRFANVCGAVLNSCKFMQGGLTWSFSGIHLVLKSMLQKKGRNKPAAGICVWHMWWVCRLSLFHWAQRLWSLFLMEASTRLT